MIRCIVILRCIALSIGFAMLSSQYVQAGSFNGTVISIDREHNTLVLDVGKGRHFKFSYDSNVKVINSIEVGQTVLIRDENRRIASINVNNSRSTSNSNKQETIKETIKETKSFNGFQNRLENGENTISDNKTADTQVEENDDGNKLTTTQSKLLKKQQRYFSAGFRNLAASSVATARDSRLFKRLSALHAGLSHPVPTGVSPLRNSGDWSYLTDFKMVVTQKLSDSSYNVFIDGRNQFVLHTGNLVLQDNFEYLVPVLPVTIKKNTHRTRLGARLHSLHILAPSQIDSYFKGNASDFDSGIPILMLGRPTQ